MKKIIFISAIVLLPFFSNGQDRCDHTISGSVMDVRSRESLPGATVIIEGTSTGTTVLANGRFEISGLCAGRHKLHIQYVGYEDLVIWAETPQQDPLSAELQPNPLLLETVIVEGENEVESMQANQVLSRDQLGDQAGKSLAESLQGITGVTSLQTGPTISKPVIHGLHSNRILILNNGIRQEGQQWGSEHAPEIDPFIASEITVVKGADAVRYGSDAIAGLVIVEPPSLHLNPSLGGEFGLGYMSNSRGYFGNGLLEGTIKSGGVLSWRIQGSIKRAGDSQAGDYVLSNTGLNELNASVAGGYQSGGKTIEVYYSRFTTELGILAASHLGNLTDLENALISDVPLIIDPFTYEIKAPRQEVSHDLFKVKALLETGRGKIELQYGGQINDRNEYDIRRSSSDARPSLSLKLYTHTLDLSWEGKYKDGLQTVLGISALLQENDNQPGTGVTPLIPDFNTYSLGAFVLEKWVKEKWSLDAGARLDYRRLKVQTFDSGQLITPDYDFFNFAATIGFEYEISNQSRYRTSLSSAFRPPHVSELFSEGLHHGAASIEEGLFIESGELIPGVLSQKPKSEVAYKWIHSFLAKRGKWEIEVSPYLSHIDNYIYLEPQDDLQLTIRGAFPVYKYVQTTAGFAGVDAGLHFHINDHLTSVAKYSMIRSRNLDDDQWLIYMPSDRYELSLQFKKEDFGKFEDLHLSIGSLYMAEQVRTNYAIEIKAPPSSYFLLNFHSGFDIQLGKEKIRAYLNIDNLLNTGYRNYLNRFRLYADDMGRNFTVRLTYDFHSHDD